MPLTEHQLDLLIKRAQAEEMETYEHYLKTGTVRYLSEEARKQMSDMSDGIRGAMALELDSVIAKHKRHQFFVEAYKVYNILKEKGGIQMEDKALADLTVEISYRKGEGFEITFPNIEGEHITEVTTEATAKTIENVLKIRRIHGASHVALPVGAKTGRITVPNPE